MRERGSNDSMGRRTIVACEQCVEVNGPVAISVTSCPSRSLYIAREETQGATDVTRKISAIAVIKRAGIYAARRHRDHCDAKFDLLSILARENSPFSRIFCRSTASAFGAPDLSSSNLAIDNTNHHTAK
jgi:hypothetical protein